MKTQAELKEHYRDVIIPRVAKYNFDHGTDVKPWECVLVNKSKLSKHPDFLYSPENYTFAITILEGKPVFVGDKLYGKNIQEYCEVIDYLNIGYGNSDDWTWTPPLKKRTFMLNGVELPCPRENAQESRLDFLGVDYYFDNVKDRNMVASSINSLLTEAREKE